MKCHLFTKKTGCLERFGQGYGDAESIQYSRPSCAWHHMQSNRLAETIRIHSWGTNAVQGKGARGPGQLNFRGTLCQLTLTAVLPENSINKYGAYLSLQGGPYMAGYGSGFATDMADHRRETMTVGCTILPSSAKRNCTVKLIPPTGYALDDRFIANSLYVDFFTVDPDRIQQLKTMYQLTPNKRMYVDLVHHWKRCTTEELDEKAAAAPAAIPTNQQNSISNSKERVVGTNIVDDRVVFGPTEYSLAQLNGNDAYFEVDYRTYFIESVTGIDYEVVVGKQVAEMSTNGKSRSSFKKKRTPLTVFFAKEPKDFYLGIDCDYDPKDKTASTCIPPTDLKLNGTKVCKGYVCRGSVRGLDPKQQYFLWVSYPRYLDPSNNDLESSRKKFKTPYATEMVMVKAWAQKWSLGKVQVNPNPTRSLSPNPLLEGS
jgi:hypothetical protein